MRSKFLTSNRNGTFTARCFAALCSIALVVVMLQMAIPPRLIAVDLSSSCQPLEEDSEPTEEFESDAEQMLFESSGPETLRNRQPGTRIRASVLKNGISARVQRPTALSHSADLLGRNGIGSPLRC